MSTALQDPKPKKNQRTAISWLGIDIGTFGVKIAEVQRRRGRLKWHSRAFRKYDHPLVDSSRDIDRITKVLADHIPPSADGESRPATVSLPSNWCIARPVNADSQEELNSHIANELGERAQTCYWEIPSRCEQPYSMAYGLRGEVAEAVGRVVNNAGHSCVQIDAQPLAMFRSISLSGHREGRCCGIVDWGWDSCLIVVCNSGGPGLARILPNSGLRYVVDGASERLAVEPATILSLLRSATPEVSDNESGKRLSDYSADVLEPHINHLANEITQSFRYAYRIGCEKLEGPLLLSGGASSLPGATDMLSSALKQETALWTWAGEKSFAATKWTAADSMYAGSLSLAVGGLEQ